MGPCHSAPNLGRIVHHAGGDGQRASFKLATLGTLDAYATIATALLEKGEFEGLLPQEPFSTTKAAALLEKGEFEGFPQEPFSTTELL
jgi:hypothetical protein